MDSESKLPLFAVLVGQAPASLSFEIALLVGAAAARQVQLKNSLSPNITRLQGPLKAAALADLPPHLGSAFQPDTLPLPPVLQGRLPQIMQLCTGSDGSVHLGPGREQSGGRWEMEIGRSRKDGGTDKEKESEDLAEGRRRASQKKRNDAPTGGRRGCPSPVPTQSLTHLFHHLPSLGHRVKKALDHLELLHGQGLQGARPDKAGQQLLGAPEGLWTASLPTPSHRVIPWEAPDHKFLPGPTGGSKGHCPH